MTLRNADILQGTMDLLVLKTLETMGAMHGWGIARRIEQVSDDLLQVSQGTLYPALIRLEKKGWIRSEWGASEKNRRAKFYSLTQSGRKQLVKETESWDQMTTVVARILEGEV